MKKVVLVALVIVLAIGLCGCITITPTTPNDDGSSPPQSQPAQPLHEKVSFHLSTTHETGMDVHSFPIYLRCDQELYLSFYAEGASVMVWVITPSDEKLGYTWAALEDPAFGHLSDGNCRSTEEGHFRFRASEEGFYIIKVESAITYGEIDVLVEYWVGMVNQ